MFLIKNRLKLGLGALVMALGLAAGAGSAIAAELVANAVSPVEFTEAYTYVAGPYYTYAIAFNVACELEDRGFDTSIRYQYGYWWVLYW